MKPNLASIVTLVAQERVADARALLNTELSERVLGALSDAKQELASNLFKSPELQEETETEKKNLVEENGYVAFYKGQRHEVHANTIYDAQKKAAAHFKAKKVWEVNIKLAEKDGKQVTHLPLDEMMTRKHFQMVADTIKSHPDQKKRNELAHHHSEIFRRENPRFDHKRFYAAANAQLKEEVLSELSKKTLSSYVKKASGDVQYKSFAQGRHTEKALTGHGSASVEKASELQHKSFKRVEGIKKAVDKIAARAHDPVKPLKSRTNSNDYHN